MRIAFLTNEFATELFGLGGLASYIHRMARALLRQGHEVEVFVTSDQEPRLVDFDGLPVHRVATNTSLYARAVRKLAALAGAGMCGHVFFASLGLAQALMSRHRAAPFDIVQSPDYMALGLMVPNDQGFCHVVRCSYAVDLYAEIDGIPQNFGNRLLARLVLQSMRRAHGVYAPSRWIAEHFQKTHGMDVKVLRPPLGREIEPAPEVPVGLPDRFLLHYGQLIKRKGTEWLCAALREAFEREPELNVVVVGNDTFGTVYRQFAALGKFRSRVLLLHALPKPLLFAVLQRAEAAILPSLVDNLPNAVIESLSFGIPVIGTRGASIDELVEPGVTGELAEPGDVQGLADAIIRVWRNQSSAKKGFHWCGDLVDAMQPETATRMFIEFCRQIRS